jgi:hypothetical protein
MKNTLETIDQTKLEQFDSKWGSFGSSDTNRVLMRIASNLSDLQHELNFKSKEELNKKLNVLKEYIFDYQNVVRF